MRKTLLATALTVAAALPVAGTAHADGPISANLTLTTDYVFRGISQSQGKAALQGGFDYAHASGLYIGTWGSNVGWVDDIAKTNNSLELDLYAGYAGEAGPLSYDVGVLQYYYPGDKIAGTPSPDSTELYLALGWEFLELKYSHAISKHLFGWTGTNGEKTRNSNYVELNAEYEIAPTWSLSAHVGHQRIRRNSDASYTDWGLGISKDVGFGTVAFNYSDSDADGSCALSQPYCFGSNGKNAAGDHYVLSFSKEF